MAFDITNIVKLIIEILVAVASLYVIPWLKLKFGEAKIAKIVEDVEIAVAAAEQIAKRDGKDCHWKKERVITGLKRISKPGLRVYAKNDEIPKVLNGLGIAIISTSKGIMTDKEARKENIGGEVLAYIW